jgi:hypothetical protein
MKLFYWKLLLFQTLFYTLLFLVFYTDSLTKDGRFLWKPFVLTFYSISVLFTFIIPMIKEYKNK